MNSVQNPFWHSWALFIFISASLSKAEHIPYCAILTRLGSLWLGTIDVLFSLGWTKKKQKNNVWLINTWWGMLSLLLGPRDKLFFLNCDSRSWQPLNPDFSTGHSRHRGGAALPQITTGKKSLRIWQVITFAEFCAFAMLPFSFQSNIWIQVAFSCWWIGR